MSSSPYVLDARPVLLEFAHIRKFLLVDERDSGRDIILSALLKLFYDVDVVCF